MGTVSVWILIAFAGVIVLGTLVWAAIAAAGVISTWRRRDAD